MPGGTENCITARIEIRRNIDGARAEYVKPGFLFSRYQWEEGNYSCDCNRELFFCAARDEYVDPEDVSCSEGRYAVRITSAETGEVLYDDI